MDQTIHLARIGHTDVMLPAGLATCQPRFSSSTIWIYPRKHDPALRIAPGNDVFGNYSA